MKNISIVLLFVSLLASCSSSKQLSYGASVATKSASSTTENVETQDRKIVYNAYLEVETKKPDNVNTGLETIAKKYEGYVLNFGNEKSVIRVKANHIHSAVEDISELCKIKNKTISGYDVTDQYADYELRLNSALKARERYLDLLKKSENVEAALKVERELERLNKEIEMLEGKIKQLSHVTAYSTINVNMKEKVKPGILGYVGIGLFKSVKWLFVRN